MVNFRHADLYGKNQKSTPSSENAPPTRTRIWNMSVGSIWAVGNVWEFWEAWGRRAVERRFADLPCTCRQICPRTLHFAGRIRPPTLHLLQICQPTLHLRGMFTDLPYHLNACLSIAYL
jgi:hypothetical protein